MKSQTKAELKPPKFGETLPNSVEGNPEPILLLEEGVETRRAVCKRCNKELTGQQRCYCSTRCKAYHHYLQKGKFKRPGVGSGGNQWGENNHQYKTGIGIFRRIAFEHYEHKCNRCYTLNDLLVHHIDENRKNNKVENLEILCKRCHQLHHTKRDIVNGKYIKG